MLETLNLNTKPQEYRQWLKNEVKEGRLPKTDLDVIHVVHENKLFNSSTGEKSSVPELQKYDIREWGSLPNEKIWDYYERMRSSEGGFDYKVLYDPTGRMDGYKGSAEEANGASNEGTLDAAPKKKGSKKAAETINIGE